MRPSSTGTLWEYLKLATCCVVLPRSASPTTFSAFSYFRLPRQAYRASAIWKYVKPAILCAEKTPATRSTRRYCCSSCQGVYAILTRATAAASNKSGFGLGIPAEAGDKFTQAPAPAIPSAAQRRQTANVTQLRPQDLAGQGPRTKEPNREPGTRYAARESRYAIRGARGAKHVQYQTRHGARIINLLGTLMELAKMPRRLILLALLICLPGKLRQIWNYFSRYICRILNDYSTSSVPPPFAESFSYVFGENNLICAA